MNEKGDLFAVAAFLEMECFQNFASNRRDMIFCGEPSGKPLVTIHTCTSAISSMQLTNSGTTARLV